jgi:anaerobic ribonucleoside-triphosphate reductase activating protein
MALLNVADWIDCTTVEGPGLRFAIWVQGCVLRCPGCCNQQFLDLVPRRLIDPADVVKAIEQAKQVHSIEGITILGGEPMIQAKGLAEVAKSTKSLGLSVMTFTGYRFEDLLDMDLPGVPEFLASTDLLVDGPFVANLPEKYRNWIGSSNQRFHYLTERYGTSIEVDPSYSGGIEIRIQRDSTIKLNGWPVDIKQHKPSKASVV